MMLTHPAQNSELFGHEQAEQQLLSEIVGGRLAHGWLFAGSRGVGKATLAYRFARYLLSGKDDGDLSMSEEHPVFRRVAAGSHSDLLVIEPIFDAKKGEAAREISVDQVREIGQFLSLTPGEGQWRVVIIDPADALNTNSANAILKILEEPPPQAVIVLITHNPARLLPTIRSRCRVLKLQPLPRMDFSRALRHASPEIDAEAIPSLYFLSGGSVGLAAQYESMGANELLEDILELLSSLPELDSTKLHGFADKLLSEQQHARFQLFNQLILMIISECTRISTGKQMVGLSAEQQGIIKRMALLHPPHVWAAKWQQASDEFSLSQRLHLDYKQVVIAFFHSIPFKEGVILGTNAA